MSLKSILKTNTSEEDIDTECVKELKNDIETDIIAFMKFPLWSKILPLRSKYEYAVSGLMVSDLFDSMLDKLNRARNKKGRGGWWRENCPAELFYKLLEEHEQKDNDGNDIDMANLAMFIYFKEFKKEVQ